MLVAAEDVTKEYPMGAGPVAALRGVSLAVQAGELVALTGPSGSGKSTLLMLLGLLDTPTGGRVLLEGRDASALSSGARARLRLSRVGYVFQDYSLHPALPALDNVALPAVARGLTEEEARARARSLLEEVGLAHRADHRPPQMSGGEQQRVAVARALVNEPALLLADEPTGNLDRESGRRVLSLLEAARERHGVAVVLVTHDPDGVPAGARRVRLVDGRVSEGT